METDVDRDCLAQKPPEVSEGEHLYIYIYINCKVYSNVKSVALHASGLLQMSPP